LTVGVTQVLEDLAHLVVRHAVSLFERRSPSIVLLPAQGRLMHFLAEGCGGSLYPALYRLEAAGEVKAVWEPESHGRRGARRRIYRLTGKGQRKLNEGRVEWQQFVQVIGGILGAPA
jgi:hypothetical protein